MPIPPPGWYADPAGSEQYRWWDGGTWTDALSVSQHARPPVDAVAAGPEPDDDATVRAGPTTSGVETLEVGPRTRLARPMAAVVVLALIAVTALGVGAVLLRPDRERASSTGAPTVNSTPDPTPNADPSAGGSGPAGTPSVPPGWVDQRSGETQIGDASMTLPGDPYAIDPDAGRLDTVVDAMFTANASVHPNYRSTNSWFSTVALLHVSADVAGDPRAATKGATATIVQWLFGTDVTPRNVATDDVIVSGHPALRVDFEAWYDIEGLPSTHDDVSLVVVALTDGSYAVALSSVPNDAPELQRTLAQAALATLSVR